MPGGTCRLLVAGEIARYPGKPVRKFFNFVTGPVKPVWVVCPSFQKRAKTVVASAAEVTGQ